MAYLDNLNQMRGSVVELIIYPEENQCCNRNKAGPVCASGCKDMNESELEAC